jgi:hypothetical protein
MRTSRVDDDRDFRNVENVRVDERTTWRHDPD